MLVFSVSFGIIHPGLNLEVVYMGFIVKGLMQDTVCGQNGFDVIESPKTSIGN